jgi:hypothetical protein
MSETKPTTWDDTLARLSPEDREKAQLDVDIWGTAFVRVCGDGTVEYWPAQEVRMFVKQGVPFPTHLVGPPSQPSGE